MRAALKVPNTGDASGGLKQDDYSCRLLDGPWFRGWSACGSTQKYFHYSVVTTLHKQLIDDDFRDGIEDIEDIVGKFEPEAADAEWMIPSQRNVDNSAYTWRHRRIMNGEDPLGDDSWRKLLLAGGGAVVVLVGGVLVGMSAVRGL